MALTGYGLWGPLSQTKGMGMVKTWRITLVVDEGWLNAINEMTSYVEDGEVCFWESVSDPIEVDPERYLMTEDEFLSILDGEDQ